MGLYIQSGATLVIAWVGLAKAEVVSALLHPQAVCTHSAAAHTLQQYTLPAAAHTLQLLHLKQYLFTRIFIPCATIHPVLNRPPRSCLTAGASDWPAIGSRRGSCGAFPAVVYPPTATRREARARVAVLGRTH